MKIAQFKIWHMLLLMAVCAAFLAWMIASGFFGPSDEELNARIYSALQQKADFTPSPGMIDLDELSTEIRRHFDFNVKIRFEGIDRNIQVRANSISGISLKNCIAIHLHECNASCRIRNGSLVIVPIDTEWNNSNYTGPTHRPRSLRGGYK